MSRRHIRKPVRDGMESDFTQEIFHGTERLIKKTLGCYESLPHDSLVNIVCNTYKHRYRIIVNTNQPTIAIGRLIAEGSIIKDDDDRLSLVRFKKPTDQRPA